MITEFITALGVLYLLDYYSEDIPGTQTETGVEVYQSVNSETGIEKSGAQTETGVEVYQSVNSETGIEKPSRISGLEKMIINELMGLDGETLPEDYESRLFSLNRRSLKAGALSLSDGELDKVDQIFDSIKDHMNELFEGPFRADPEGVQAAKIEAVYVYAFSHKATTLECLTSNDICQPTNTRHITYDTKSIASSNNKDTVLDNYKSMFSFDRILKQSKVSFFGYQQPTSGNRHELDLTQKELLRQWVTDITSLSRVVRKGEEFPAMGYRAVFLMSDSNNKDIFIETIGKSYTHEYNAEELSNMLKTIPGKQISKLTGFGKKLHKKNQP
ncbi:hypothetical protein [Endozoicomonas sp. 4G]|uniref:hypothetical protein n=1 Tax=Endozoicomonas sp. 4G TaxID=2872754 RepID=UPI00207898C3|nr:hypothetical protein [Endozoicomonas sp. 4G]